MGIATGYHREACSTEQLRSVRHLSRQKPVGTLPMSGCRENAKVQMLAPDRRFTQVPPPRDS